MQLRFATVDVFTDTRFAGNPLAVVLNADGISTEQMQAIAAEFNLSETTFVLPPKDPANTAQVRIFTPRYEMPFAGHPNVGTAFVLARDGISYGRMVGDDRVVFEEIAGLVPVTLLKDDETIVGARLAAPQPLSIGAEIPIDIVAAACGLAASDIDITNHLPCFTSCGAQFIIAELNSYDALKAAAPRSDVFSRHFTSFPTNSLHLYVQAESDGVDIRTRMFAPLHNIPEDPATGSANVALIGLLAHLRPERDLTLTKTIMQGFEMGRPSLLYAEAIKRDGVVTQTFIGGRCVPMMSGTIDI